MIITSFVFLQSSLFKNPTRDVHTVSVLGLRLDDLPTDEQMVCVSGLRLDDQPTDVQMMCVLGLRLDDQPTEV